MNKINIVKAIVRYFNDSSLLSFLLVPLKYIRFWRGAQRTRICESCLTIGRENIHWTKDDKLVGKNMIYNHKYLCDRCFYNI